MVIVVAIRPQSPQSPGGSWPASLSWARPLPLQPAQSEGVAQSARVAALPGTRHYESCSIKYKYKYKYIFRGFGED